MWVSGEKSLSDLDTNKDKSIGTLSFIDVSFSDANIRRIETSLKGRKVERISIYNCRGSFGEALSIIFDCVLVECLKLDCVHISPSTAKVIEQGVATCSSLKCLVLQAITITSSVSQALHRALTKARSLESLYFSSITPRPAASNKRWWIKEILDGLSSNQSLKHLGLARVQDMDASDVLHAICLHPLLETISFACLDGLSPSMLAALRELSQSTESRIRSIKLSVRGDWTGLAKLPRRPSNYQTQLGYKLSISMSPHNCRDMHVLGEILVRNPDIHSLSLAHCGLCEEDIASLASHLKDTKGLKTLSLLGNILNSGVGCVAILAALSYNHSLERIDFPTLIEQKREIDHLLDCNRAGRRFLKEVRAPVSLWPVVVARAGMIDYTTSYPIFTKRDEIEARRANAIYHLLHHQGHCIAA